MINPASAEPLPLVGGATHVRLHELALRADGEEWIVGRMATGEFVALPETGKRALDLLGQGLSSADVSERLRCDFGLDIDVPGFIHSLIEIDFVAELDGQSIPGPQPPSVMLPWLLPRHVHFILSPVVPMLVGGVIIAATVALLRHLELSLSYRTLLWSPHESLVMGLGASAGWALLLIHEFAHFVAARATGVHGRISLGTRLQFLVMQTDISGIELAPRRHRLSAYMAGIAVNLTVAAIAVLIATATDPSTVVHRIFAALVLIALLPLSFQLLIFTRTDIYFVVQDLTNCRNLYGDGTAYAKYAARRIAHALVRRGTLPADPSLRLAKRERQAVRMYSIVLVLGSVVCVAFMVTITLPADVTLLVRAVLSVGPGQTLVENLDAAAVLIGLGGMHILWAATWWRKHRRKPDQRKYQ